MPHAGICTGGQLDARHGRRAVPTVTSAVKPGAVPTTRLASKCLGVSDGGRVPGLPSFPCESAGFPPSRE